MGRRDRHWAARKPTTGLNSCSARKVLSASGNHTSRSLARRKKGLWMDYLVEPNHPYWLCKQHTCNLKSNTPRACQDRGIQIPPEQLKRPQGCPISVKKGGPKTLVAPLLGRKGPRETPAAWSIASRKPVPKNRPVNNDFELSWTSLIR